MQAQKIKGSMANFSKVVRNVCAFLFKYRKIFLAIPVIVAASYLAWRGGAQLPESVGVILNSKGMFSVSISKSLAIWGSFGITMLCVALMCLSRKVLYPWLVSWFSMALPILLMALNYFVHM